MDTMKDTLEKTLKSIRKQLITNKYKMLGEQKMANRAFGRQYNKNLSFEDNSLAISQYCLSKQYRMFNAETLKKARYLLKGVKGRTRDDMTLGICNSILNAGKNISGQVFQRQMVFLLRKAFPWLKIKSNWGKKDVAIRFKGKMYAISVKITVKDRSNDNDRQIKIVNGSTCYGNGGFTSGFLDWMNGHENKILIIINPEARKQAIEFAERSHGFTPRVFSLDDGIQEIRKLLHADVA